LTGAFPPPTIARGRQIIAHDRPPIMKSRGQKSQARDIATLEKELRQSLTDIASLFHKLGEDQQKWERSEINWKKGEPPFDDLYFYVALATVWQSFSRRLEGERRRAFVMEVYDTFREALRGRRTISDLEAVLRRHRSSRFKVGANLLELWLRIARELSSGGVPLDDPLAIQRVATRCSSRSQHWSAYAPLEAAVVVGELFPCHHDLIPPLGTTVMRAFAHLGLPFSYPPIKKELDVIRRFLLQLAELAGTNHLLIEMGIWLFGWNLENQV